MNGLLLAPDRAPQVVEAVHWNREELTKQLTPQVLAWRDLPVPRTDRQARLFYDSHPMVGGVQRPDNPEASLLLASWVAGPVLIVGLLPNGPHRLTSLAIEDLLRFATQIVVNETREIEGAPHAAPLQ